MQAVNMISEGACLCGCTPMSTCPDLIRGEPSRSLAVADRFRRIDRAKGQACGPDSTSTLYFRSLTSPCPRHKVRVTYDKFFGAGHPRSNFLIPALSPCMRIRVRAGRSRGREKRGPTGA
jgi:hypothetical protein